jgi:FKBP-type peptidyl-prolyl cis-trans isomerase (trigger factor)
VIDKIIELEKIEASDKEIEAEYKKIAGVKDQDKDADKKIAQVKKQYRINQVAYQVKANKVIELLKANAITKTQKSE